MLTKESETVYCYIEYNYSDKIVEQEEEQKQTHSIVLRISEIKEEENRNPTKTGKPILLKMRSG